MGLNGSVFLDSSVVALALGGVHERRQDCRDLLAATARGVQLHCCVELVQAVLFHRLRRGPRQAAVDQAYRLIEAFTLHDLTAAVLLQSVRLTETTAIGGRDAVHAACALEAGFDQIVSVDRDFEGVPGLRRLTPAQTLRQLTST